MSHMRLNRVIPCVPANSCPPSFRMWAGQSFVLNYDVKSTRWWIRSIDFGSSDLRALPLGKAENHKAEEDRRAPDATALALSRGPFHPAPFGVGK